MFLLDETTEGPRDLMHDSELGARQDRFRARLADSGLVVASVVDAGGLETALLQALVELPRVPVASPSPYGAASLDELLSGCVVRIDDGGRFRGSGFFIAPDEVLTCAHVVADGTDVTVTWDEGSARVAVTADHHPFPDVALLRLIDPAGSHPCVQLDSVVPVIGPPVDVLMTTAWTADVYAPDTAIRTRATFEFAGQAPTEKPGQPLMVKNGQVAHGFCGAPLVNIRTGTVCALMHSALDTQSEPDGFGVPISVVLDALPGAGARSTAFHRGDERWWHALERDRVDRAALDDQKRRLPLTAPLVELDWDVSGSRTELLHPRYGIVPFIGRGDLLANLMLWREQADPLSVVVLAGPGGFGKTRTAIEACAEAGRAGWISGLLTGSDSRSFGGLDALTACAGRLYLVVDYAETRPPGAVAELLRCLLARPATAPARVVLVMRQGGTRHDLRSLLATGDRRLELEQVVRSADLVRMDQDVAQIERAELFRIAAEVFGRRLRRTAQPRSPDLAAPHFARPLFVLAAALLCTAEADVDVAGLAADDVLGAVLDRHEAEYWDRWNQRLGVGLSREQQRQAVALVALFGAENSRDALALVGSIPGLAGAAQSRREDVVRWLAHLYSSGDLDGTPLVRPLEPDLLAEVLIARELGTGGPA